MTAGGARFSGKSVWILFEKLQLSVYQKEEQKNRPEKSDLIPNSCWDKRSPQSARIIVALLKNALWLSRWEKWAKVTLIIFYTITTI